MAHRSRLILGTKDRVGHGPSGSFSAKDLDAMVRAEILPADHGYPSGDAETGVAAAINRARKAGRSFAKVSGGKTAARTISYPVF